MHGMNKNANPLHRARLASLAVGVLLLMSGLCLAQRPNRERFPSAEKATQALFEAVQSDNEADITQILGGRKELVSSGDPLNDRHERELFTQKYREMHRLVEEPDRTTTLYIGAENWPFPVPLVSRNGQWFFDADAGAHEVLFRRVGENEASTAEICRGVGAAVNGQPEPQANTDDADLQYALALVDAGPPASSEHHAQGQQSSAPLHGYFFRKFKNGKAGAETFTVVAYPAEYRVSGVMTFVVTPRGVLYEKDLGPRTRTLAPGMTSWKLDRSWHMADENPPSQPVTSLGPQGSAPVR